MDVTPLTPISHLIANKRKVSALKSLGIETVEEALAYYPFRVTDPVPARAVGEVQVGQALAFPAVVRGFQIIPMGGRRGYRFEAMVDDSVFAASRHVSASLVRLTFFSHKKPYMDWLGMRMHSGAQVVVAGTLGEYNNQPQFMHPEVLTVALAGIGGVADATDRPSAALASPGSLKFDASNQSEALLHVCRPRPIYHANSRISSEHIHEVILVLLKALGVLVESDHETEEQGAMPNSSSASGKALGRLSGTDGFQEDVSSIHAVTAPFVPDVLPQKVIDECGLLHRAAAFAAVHDPHSVEQFAEGLKTLRYEEAFVSQIAVLQARQQSRTAHAFPCTQTGLREEFIDSLPFDLTSGQRQVIDEMGMDMQRLFPMQRLLEGEVGSGKTVVALAAMLQAVASGGQALLVAPTLVLAEQHERTIGSMVSKLATPVDVILFTGGMKLSQRRQALARMANGSPGIIVATHAALSRHVQIPNLALTVIDEQHRFGVEQREVVKDLNTKDADGKPIPGGKAPHMLVMTATPIPRSAAMTWFGDLDVSELTQLPGGRRPVKTVVVPEADNVTMSRMFTHLRRRIDAGERVYIVCPRIEEDSDEADDGVGVIGAGGASSVAGAANGGVVGVSKVDAASANTAGAGAQRHKEGTGQGFTEPDFVEFEGTSDSEGDGTGEPKAPLHSVGQMKARLSVLPQFQGVEFATLTGRDDDETKLRVMADFKSGRTPVLVSTTVIEVGVDVPQASCIVIFDADRFGLSQLHQLRGRVGRGGTDAWAFLISRAEPGSIAQERLEVIRTSSDGARIAEADLELRGAGDVIGDRQSGGKSGLKLLRVVKDKAIIVDARTRAERLLEADPDLKGAPDLAGAVLDFTRGAEKQILSS